MTRPRPAKPLVAERTEAAVQREALKLWRAYGIVLRRTNTRVVTLPGKGGKLRPVFFGEAGDPDSAGCLPDGRYCGCEYKREGWRPDRVYGKALERWRRQLARLREINASGGVGLWLNQPEIVHSIAPKLLAGARVVIDDAGWPWVEEG